MQRGLNVVQRQLNIAGAAVLATLLVTSRAVAQADIRIGILTLIGFFAGYCLYRTSFGFASAWRHFLLDRRGIGIRAQIVMLAVTVPAFYLLLARGELMGIGLDGFVAPVGAALVLGAFMFGIGMQLAGGCASGTLYTAGGGSVRMAVTLAAFVLGSLIATANPLGWQDWPALPPWSMVESWGAFRATVCATTALLIAYICVARAERKAHGFIAPLIRPFGGPVVVEHSPLIFGALALALVNLATLVVVGRPWGITSAFALWGAKIATFLGGDVAAWRHWQGDPSLEASVFADATSVMNFGLMLGALTAAALAARFRPSFQITSKSALTAAAGGLLMGVGARLGTGCNIGAYFSGIASGSLHGVVWLLAAVPGTIAGLHIRKRLDQMRGAS